MEDQPTQEALSLHPENNKDFVMVLVHEQIQNYLKWRMLWNIVAWDVEVVGEKLHGEAQIESSNSFNVIRAHFSWNFFDDWH